MLASERLDSVAAQRWGERAILIRLDDGSRTTRGGELTETWQLKGRTHRHQQVHHGRLGPLLCAGNCIMTGLGSSRALVLCLSGRLLVPFNSSTPWHDDDSPRVVKPIAPADRRGRGGVVMPPTRLCRGKLANQLAISALPWRSSWFEGRQTAGQRKTRDTGTPILSSWSRLKTFHLSFQFYQN